jgi:AraC-like DNA-binding protein
VDLSEARSRQHGDVLFAGRQSLVPSAPVEPSGPGDWMLTYTVRGRALFVWGGKESIARAGDLVLLRCDSGGKRGVLEGEPWQALTVRFNPWPRWQPAGFRRITPGLLQCSLALAGTRLRIRELCESMIEGFQVGGVARIVELAETTDSRMESDRLHTELALLRLQEIFVLAQQDPLVAQRFDPRIREALQLLSTDPTAPHRVSELAERFGVSSDWFGRLFRAQVGSSPRRLLRRIRLHKAAMDLQYTDDPITTIAERAGFSSIYDLSRTFRGAYHVSPRQYRSEHR